MEKVTEGDSPDDGVRIHSALEAAWRTAGVLSSSKKKVSGEPVAHELGAMLQGDEGTIGPSPDRLLRLIQTTLVVIGRQKLCRKWVQVCAGRWVHCMSFRRPAMVWLDVVWSFISGKAKGSAAEYRVRSEFFNCICGCLLMHTNLRSEISSTTTASDASSTGGAVGKSERLTQAGQEFVGADLAGRAEGTRAPILVLSLFNGIGCAFRCYDLCGIVPAVCISYELCKAANRVTSRRWPNVKIETDVRTLGPEQIKEWKYLYPEVEEIHIWAGFPCVGLSAVWFGRLNLDDPQSGLFWELVRIIRQVRQGYGFSFPVKFAAENVASMDVAAEQEISATLGIKPWRFDSADVVPVHRPRLCWSNTELTEMGGVDFVEKERWWEIKFSHEYPATEQWIEEGWSWPGFDEGAILPTCMKAIRRSSPPIKPAGIDRVDWDGKQRWAADEFRFPPYQYSSRFVFWKGDRWRLASASERELLHGLGYEHTALCWAATDVKQNPRGFEDKRKSLVGDGCNCFTFAFVAAMLCKRWIQIPHYQLLWERMGLAPGFCPPLETKAPLVRRLSYGVCNKSLGVTAMHASLLRRVNHTGSDVRITTGMILNPKAYPRQSSCSAWWVWSKVFACRWSKADHINSLELRSIIHSLEWRINHLKECQIRAFHLTDSYVAMSIISKGRSSSRMLKPLLCRLAVALLAWDLYLVVSHVESLDNPTDDASRA